MKIDNINYPSHYLSHPSGIECIDIVKHWSFPLGNAFKYLFRCGFKGDALEDLRKAQWYVKKELEIRQKIHFRFWTGESSWRPLIDASPNEVLVLRVETRHAGNMRRALGSLMKAAACPRGCQGLEDALHYIEYMILTSVGRKESAV